MFISPTDASVIILGGLSVRNIARTAKFEEYFQDKVKNVHRIYYKHRQNNNESMDMQYEIEQLAHILKTYAVNDKIVILAKSAGCMILLQTMEKYPEFQEMQLKCIFMGFPMGMHDGIGGQHALFSVRFPYLGGYVIQNKQDPVAGYDEVVPVFEGSRFTMIELPGDNHHYQLEDVEHLNLVVF